MVVDVLSIYAADVAPRQSRPSEVAGRLLRLGEWWATKRLSEVTGRTCRAYAEHRGSPAAARRELEDLRAAIRHHRAEGLCREVVEVVLPPKSQSRERWMTRDEVARLVWAAWRHRDPSGRARMLAALQGGTPPASLPDCGDVRERVARKIYERFDYEGFGTKPQWVERGNSFRQEDARYYADAALAAIRPGDTLPGTPKTGPLMVVPMEATEAILDAMRTRIEELDCRGDGWPIGGADMVYDAMLAAAREAE